jgi:hypothetical protein
MPEPFEILAQPFTAWIAAVGSAFPTVDEAPGGSWTKIGSSGDLNYTEDGVTISHEQTIEKFRPLGSTGARKAFRTEEDQMISFVLADMTLEQLKAALNGNSITTTAPGVGTAGTKKIGLSRGLEVTEYALLLRSSQGSAYGDDFVMQYEVPRCYQNSNPEIVYVKGEPAGVQMEFVALEDPDAASADERFGRLVQQHLEAGT